MRLITAYPITLLHVTIVSMSEKQTKITSKKIVIKNFDDMFSESRKTTKTSQKKADVKRVLKASRAIRQEVEEYLREQNPTHFILQ